MQIGLPKLPDVASSDHFAIIRRWLQNCDASHPKCRPSDEALLPKRLLHVGDKNLTTIRLYETKPGDCVKTFPYIALSHPWGSPPHYCTEPSNIAEHKQGIDFARLPATFQDAVSTTRELGFRYLWIDSLCIVQGPDGDFNEEAERMEDVYSSASCVIAASSATGQGDGFLKSRNERKFLTIQQDEHSRFYVCQNIDNFNGDVLEGNLNQRGWVLQERTLAHRTIYFTKAQTYWECGGGVRCETLTKTHK